MSSTVPTPVAAALGVVPAVLSGVRSLPSLAIALPVRCVGSALNGLDRTRRGYDDLAERGERLISSLRGTSFDELEDRVEDALQGTPLAKPYDLVEDALEDVGENVAVLVRSTPAAVRSAPDAVRSAPARARKAAGGVAKKAADGLDRVADDVEDLAAGVLPDRAADAVEAVVDTADDVVEKVQNVVEKVDDVVEKVQDTTAGLSEGARELAADVEDELLDAAAARLQAATPDAAAPVGGAVVDRDELPLADFDHLTLGAVRGKLRGLDVTQLVQLRDYERSKSNRLPIVTMLDNRIAKLASTTGAGSAQG